MKGKIAACIGFSLVIVMLFGMTVYVYPAKAVNVNVNQDTFVLSNEAPGYGISELVNAGYGNMNLYQTLVQIADDSNPSVSGILTPQFMQTLKNAPASAQIFTTKLKDVNSQGATIGVSTDGTFLTNGVIVGLGNYTTITSGDIFGSTYQGKQGITSLDTVVSSVGSFRLVYNSSGPLTTWTVNGPLAGMTTTYNIFGILYAPSATASSSPSSSPTSSSVPTSIPASNTSPTSSSTNPANYTYPIIAIVAVLVVVVVVLVVLKKKKTKKQ
jgi:hypothetical protein